MVASMRYFVELLLCGVNPNRPLELFAYVACMLS